METLQLFLKKRNAFQMAALIEEEIDLLNKVINLFLSSNFMYRLSSSHIASVKIDLLILLLGRKVMTNLDSILKSRDNNLSTKVHLVKAMVFPGVMYGCESWTIKKAECRRNDAFELWCWRRLLRVP